jgi:hypothetical protein
MMNFPNGISLSQTASTDIQYTEIERTASAVIATPIMTNFGALGDLSNIINCASFGVDRFKGFYSVKGRK